MANAKRGSAAGDILNKSITRWPRCKFCKLEYVIRRANVVNLANTPMEFSLKWVWMRDCAGPCRKAHRKPIVEMATTRST